MAASAELRVDLATRQRQLRDLIKGRGVPVDADPYVRDVATSPGLDMVREIVLWWRALGIERTCPLTAAVLKRRERFDAAVATFVRDHALTPYRDELGPRFLEASARDADPLVAAIACFERATNRVKQGDPGRYVIAWPCEPYAVLKALISGFPFDETSTHGGYQTVVSADLPGCFRVVGEKTSRERA